MKQPLPEEVQRFVAMTVAHLCDNRALEADKIHTAVLDVAEIAYGFGEVSGVQATSERLGSIIRKLATS